MRVIATTVVRESIRGKQRTGWIYDVDWESGTVARKLPVPEPLYPESDRNPRGGVRGGRGVAVTRRGIVVANYDSLHVYDDDWNALDSLSHPLFVGTHEIDWDGERLWTAATGLDLVLRVTLDGDVDVGWDAHASALGRRLGLGPRAHAVDGSVDYRLREAPLVDQCHINGVARADGATIVNCGLVRRRKPRLQRLAAKARRRLEALRPPEQPRQERRRSGTSLVVRVNGTPEPDVLLELAGHDFPTHNGQLLDDRTLAVNDSTHNTFRVFDPGSGRQRLELRVPGTWLRGLEPLDARRVLVGTAPATIALLDLEERAVVSSVRLSDDPNEAVHGLTLCPPQGERP